MLIAALSVSAAAGCTGDDEAPVPDPDSSAYVAALTEFLPRANPDEQPNVIVAPVDEPLALDNQVAIIEQVGDGYDVKFVDDAATAVDKDAEGRPTHDDALLIILGRIPAEPPYVLRVETYRNADDSSANLVTLVWRTDHWAVATSEPVDFEAIIVDA